MIREMIEVKNAPSIPGLVFRPFQGEADYAGMVDCIIDSNVEDKLDSLETVESLAIEFRHMQNCDPATDMLMIEAEGKLVGFGRVWWWVDDVKDRLYGVTGVVHPEWRARGIGRALLGWQEQRIREIAAAHPVDEPRYIQAFSMDAQQRRLALFKHAGYESVRYGYMMVRPNLADAPEEWPLPEGLEVRAVQKEHMRQIWEALEEAFRDHWGHRPRDEGDYQQFLAWPDAMPHLWQVAWDRETNEVAGMVLNNIFNNENERFHQRRGWTDPICVRRPWRRRGLARALIMRSLKVLRDQGMTEAALGVDAQNPNKALHLYESCGYQIYQRSFTLRKALGPA